MAGLVIALVLFVGLPPLACATASTAAARAPGRRRATGASGIRAADRAQHAASTQTEQNAPKSGSVKAGRAGRDRGLERIGIESHARPAHPRSSGSSPRRAGGRPRGGTAGPTRARRSGRPGSRSARCARAGRRRPAGRRRRGATGRRRRARAGARAARSPAASGVASTVSQPASGCSAGRTSAPSARASSWPPRQMPSTGTPSSTASRSSSRSRAEVRQPLLVPGVHRAAERHDAAEVARAQAVEIALPGVGGDDRQPAPAHDAPEQPEPGQRRILLDGEDGLHRSAGALGSERQDFLGAAARRGFFGRPGPSSRSPAGSRPRGSPRARPSGRRPSRPARPRRARRSRGPRPSRCTSSITRSR